MVNVILNWFAKRQHNANMDEVLRGYQFAAGHLLMGAPISELENALQESLDANDYDYFDKGIRQAIKDWDALRQPHLRERFHG